MSKKFGGRLSAKLHKIAVVSSSCPPLGSGGISSAHYNLALALRNQGMQVRLFTFDDSARFADDPPFLVRSGTPQLLKKIIRRLCSLCLRLKRGSGVLRYQLAYILANQIGAWRAGRRIRTFHPDIVILPDHGCPGLAIGRLPQCTMILVSHHNPGRFTNPLIFGAQLCFLDIDLAVNLENRALHHIDMVICPSRYMEDCFKQTYAFTGPVHVIPNILSKEGLDAIVPISPAKELGLPHDTPVIYIPSGTSPVKGERFVFEIIRRIRQEIPETAFFISGEPSASFVFELHATGLNSHVLCPGQTSYQENLAFVAGSSLCVSPAIAENFSMALLEAQYFALPVVTFDVGGNKEIVADMSSGYCVPYLDVDALVKKTLFLLHPDRRSLFQAMRDNSIARARKIIECEAVEQYLHALIGEKQPAPQP